MACLAAQVSACALDPVVNQTRFWVGKEFREGVRHGNRQLQPPYPFQGPECGKSVSQDGPLSLQVMKTQSRVPEQKHKTDITLVALGFVVSCSKGFIIFICLPLAVWGLHCCRFFSSCRELRLLPSCSTQAFHSGALSCCRAQT